MDRCNGDRPIIGRFFWIVYFGNGDNHCLFPLFRYETVIQEEIQDLCKSIAEIDGAVFNKPVWDFVGTSRRSLQLAHCHEDVYLIDGVQSRSIQNRILSCRSSVILIVGNSRIMVIKIVSCNILINQIAIAFHSILSGFDGIP